jgi:sugar O-acyltransferase (sialic acid O-acetyltransferase NeuD family)
VAISYVMFGHSHFLGNLLDIIHARQGRLSQIIENVPEPLHPERLPLDERLARISYPVDRVRLEEWAPSENSRYVVGFSGIKMKPLVANVKRKFGIEFERLIHPAAILSPTALFDEGCVADAGAMIGPYARIGKHTFTHRGALVGHDVEIEDYVVIGPGATICGYSRVKRGARICAGATVIEDTTIGEEAVVAAGAVVIAEVSPAAMVAGVPAERKKEYAS